MGWLDGVSALVTGGAAGMGRAIVDRFLVEGARVAAMDLSEDKLADVRKHGGDSVVTYQGDVTSIADNEAAVEAAVAAFGGLDVFIPNAGIWDFGRSLLDTPADELAAGFDELISINVKGYLLGAKAAVGPLRESKGCMIFTLSNASFFPAGGGPIYTAAKHANLGLVRQLAYELAPDVRVNGVAPGGMATDLKGPGALGLGQKSISTDVPIGEVMRKGGALARENTAAEYAASYVLLASRTASPTATGTVIDLSSFGTPRRPDL